MDNKWIEMGVSFLGVPQKNARDFLKGKNPIYEWMMTRGSPIFGKISINMNRQKLTRCCQKTCEMFGFFQRQKL